MEEQIDSPLYRILTSELGLTDREILMSLTPRLADVARTVGLGPVMKLLDYYQGRKVFIPSLVNGWSSFLSLFGKETAGKLIDCLGGGQTFEVGTPFGPKSLARLAALKVLREGGSTSEVARRCGISHSSIKGLRRRYGLPPPPDPYTGLRAEAFKMFAAGKPIRDIAIQLGVTLRTVRGWQRRYRGMT